MDVASTLPIWSIIPFVGMLLSIAIFPLVKGEWWERHELHVAVFWALIFCIPFGIAYGGHELTYQLTDAGNGLCYVFINGKYTGALVNADVVSGKNSAAYFYDEFLIAAKMK